MSEGVKEKELEKVLIADLKIFKIPNETVIKYSLQGIESPIGVTNYQLEKALSPNLKSELPTAEEFEQEVEQSYEELKNPTDKKPDRLKNFTEPERVRSEE